jgi:hypothetical protein
MHNASPQVSRLVMNARHVARAPSIQHRGGGRGCGATATPTCRGGRGTQRGRGVGRGRNAGWIIGGANMEDPTPHWIPLAITPTTRSPIFLRRRMRDARRDSEGTVGDPILVGEENANDREDFICEEVEEKMDVDSDCQMLDKENFHTPPPLPRGTSVTLSSSLPGLRSAVCQFTLVDFTPGAAEPNPYLRQSLGEYLPWLHNCGEETCPFTEPSAELQRLSLETGMPLPNLELSPGDHVRVDQRAFTKPTYVKVALELLGYDPGMWGGLQEFSSIVVDRYYQQVTGSPMFSIDFGGSIAQREVKVCDTRLDTSRQSSPLPRRSLFGTTSTEPEAACTTTGDTCNGPPSKYSCTTLVISLFSVPTVCKCMCLF